MPPLAGFEFLLARVISVHPTTLALHFAILLSLCVGCYAVGCTLLQPNQRTPSWLQLTLCSAWGWMFLASSAASLLTRGQTIYLVIPLMQLLFWGRLKRSSTGSGQANRSVPHRTPVRPLHLGLAAVALFFYQVRSATTILPYLGDGRWQVADKHLMLWANLAEQLVRQGKENLESAMFWVGAADSTHYYHFLDLWFVGVLSEWTGQPAIVTLAYVSYPFLTWLFVGAVLSTISCFRPVDTVALFVAILSPFFAPLLNPVVGTYLVRAFALYRNSMLAVVLLAIAPACLSLRSLPVVSGLLLGVVLASPVSLPVVGSLSGLLVVVALALRRRRPEDETSKELVRIAFTVSMTFVGAVVWLFAVKRVQLLTMNSERELWSWANATEVIATFARSFAEVVLLGLPLFIAVAYVLRKPARYGPCWTLLHRLLLWMPLVAGVLIAANIGLLHHGPNSRQVAALAASALITPMGLTALLLVSDTGKKLARISVAAVFILGVALGLGRSFFYHGYGSREYQGQSIEQTGGELSVLCKGIVGYFGETNNQFFSSISGWAAFEDCRFADIEKGQNDRAGGRFPYMFDDSLLSDFARRTELDWNAETTALKFAKSQGISRFVEVPSRNLLIPAAVKKQLEYFRKLLRLSENLR